MHRYQLQGVRCGPKLFYNHNHVRKYRSGWADLGAEVVARAGKGGKGGLPAEPTSPLFGVCAGQRDGSLSADFVEEPAALMCEKGG